MVAALALPLLVFGIPQLFGMTDLSGDNFLQNFPMRVLVGTDLIHGALPLWNPYLFSGTPLLGGFNAGAAYPVTWLTAVLPIFTAWTLTLAITYDVALAGMYLFLRRQGIASTAATFGAVTFALAGYMTAQQVHIDLIEGAAWLPWILVAVHGLTAETGSVVGVGSRPGRAARSAARSARRRTRGWVLVLTLALGLTLLAGAAEAIIDSGVLVAMYWVWRLADQGYLRRGSGRALVRSVAAVPVGLVAGVALGTAQWLPGTGLPLPVPAGHGQLRLLHQRIAQQPPRGPGRLTLRPRHQPDVATSYAGTYNFPEVTSYVGILALIAACLFLKRWRRRPEARQWWIWYGILVIGVLSPWATRPPSPD